LEKSIDTSPNQPQYLVLEALHTPLIAAAGLRARDPKSKNQEEKNTMATKKKAAKKATKKSKKK
jgi:hypothetical protein